MQNSSQLVHHHGAPLQSQWEISLGYVVDPVSKGSGGRRVHYLLLDKILGKFALLLLRTRHNGRPTYELTESYSPEF